MRAISLMPFQAPVGKADFLTGAELLIAVDEPQFRILCARLSIANRSIYANQQDEVEDCGHRGQVGGPAVHPEEPLDQFATGPMTGEAVNAASMTFKKALIERALGAGWVTTWDILAVRTSPRPTPTSATA